MLKGKQLYKEAREFVDEQMLPMLAEERSEDEDDAKVDEVKDKAVELGLALLIDVAESLHGIKAKID